MAATTIGSTGPTRDTSSGGRCLSSLGGGLPFGSSFGLGPGGGSLGASTLSFGSGGVFGGLPLILGCCFRQLRLFLGRLGHRRLLVFALRRLDLLLGRLGHRLLVFAFR